MKNVLISVVLLGSIGVSHAQSCRSIRECQIQMQQMQTQVNFLKNENVKLFSALNECRLSTAPVGNGPINNNQLDLLFSLQNKKFEAYNKQICGGTTCGTTKLKFVFVNDTLKAQMETEGTNWSIGKETINVTVPDKYGEFVVLPHPHDVRSSRPTQCRYIVEKDAQGNVTSLELLDEVDRGTSNCPEDYKLQK